MDEFKVPGWAEVVEWFGAAPSFHDAEVESIDLRRGLYPTIIRVHVWRTNGALDEDGHFSLDRHATVSFVLTGVVQQDLTGWNDQNVLFDLRLSKEEETYVLTLDASYGLSGEIAATGMRIEVIPHPKSAG